MPIDTQNLPTIDLEEEKNLDLDYTKKENLSTSTAADDLEREEELEFLNQLQDPLQEEQSPEEPTEESSKKENLTTSTAADDLEREEELEFLNQLQDPLQEEQSPEEPTEESSEKENLTTITAADDLEREEELEFLNQLQDPLQEEQSPEEPIEESSEELIEGKKIQLHDLLTGTEEENKTTQRVARVVIGNQDILSEDEKKTIENLQQAGLGSAHEIAQITRTDFLENYSQHFPNLEQAKLAHQRAITINTQNVLKFIDLFHQNDPYYVNSRFNNLSPLEDNKEE
jgi:hypothetical protein